MYQQTTKLSWKEAVEFMTDFSVTPEANKFALYELELGNGETYGFSMETGMIFSVGLHCSLVCELAEFDPMKYVANRIKKQREETQKALETGDGAYFTKHVVSKVEMKLDADRIKKQLELLLNACEQYLIKYGYTEIDESGNIIGEEDD